MSITPPADLAESNLFKPLQVGSVELKNRLVLAPTTRIRNTKEHVVTDSVAEFYAERAENNGGLLIFEATTPAPSLGFYNYAPFIQTEQQVNAFKKVTEAVHKKGSSIAIQLWGLGRTADPKAMKEAGLPLKAPSAIYYNEATEKAAKEAGNELQELTIPEIKAYVKEFAEGAKRSVEAGFDIVEIHGAHQYLVDQFLQSVSNKRTDEYGGSIENRARFLFEVVDAMIEAVGAEKVAIRLSPYAEVQGGLGYRSELNPIVTWGYVLSELERRAKEGKRIAYISVVEPRVNGVDDNPDAANIDFTWPDLIWKGPIIRAGAYLHSGNIEHVKDTVNRNDRTLIAVGRYFTSNPDLAHRLKNGLELTPYERAKFYIPCSNVGYLGYGKAGEDYDHSKDEVVPKALA